MASELTLPGTFEEGKKVLWKGSDARAWKRALEEDRIIAGEGLTESISAKGRTLSVTPGSGSVGDGFLKFYVWKDGLVMTVDIATNGAPVPLPEA